ncbi:hypothetical protein GCM10011399_00650 [Subtercola lobariae]|uniref:SGNH hydrolase-type esterase domain-containing protein n=2 Tax=Subtercola lobariae TaxID=1588641 RepID=A0A917ETB7_9MICO|nr:hypothetical protein GCM10011399_00650 [Subtercola lobariae]
MDGHGVDPAEAWPLVAAEQNNWQLTDLAVDGTGFLQLGNDDNTFQAQVDEAQTLSPSVVIISASSNDLGQDDSALAAATLSTMQSLRAALPQAQIIALSAFWGDTTAPPQLDSVDSALVIAANATGATYVDIGQPLAGRPDLMQSDDVHPTADGLRMLGEAISSDLALEAPVAQNPGG